MDRRVPFSPARKRCARAIRKATALHAAGVFREHRERCKLTFEALSEHAVISISRLKKFETAESSPIFPDEFFRLASAFGVRAEILMRQTVLPVLETKAARKAKAARQ
jgi:transcriptional regulator with XRE-family HTH domain